MLFLLSPAKALDFDTPPTTATHTQPLFTKQSTELMDVLKKKTPEQIAALMHLSENLSALNAARYAAWVPKFSAKNAKQAVLAFDGDVYGGLDAKTLSAAQLAWAQEHVRILSGLYGVLRPLDWMQPYRLEMGTALATPKGKNLYQYWGTQIADYLNAETVHDKEPIVVNLASDEYFKSVDKKALKARIVTCVFEEYRGGKYKVISFFAKRARGLMARHAVQKKITSVRKLEAFASEGYAFDRHASEQDRLVFRRKEAA